MIDSKKLQAAAIRLFWATVFPLLGAGLTWLSVSGNVESIGVNQVLLASVISGVCYGLKKLFFPDTTL